MPDRHQRWLIGLSVATGLALLVIGVRFITAPRHAAQFFGIGTPSGPFDLHYVIGVRDLWLALAILALGWMREWRALAVMLGLGAIVCFADSAIAASSSGRTLSIMFHAASGVFCAGVALACWRMGQRGP